MVMFKTLSRFLGLISTMILARILVPEDYGLIAMAMSFYVLIEIMAAMGFDVSSFGILHNSWRRKLLCQRVFNMIETGNQNKGNGCSK